MQDVWTNIIKTRQRYIVGSKFPSFLYKIAHNRLIDHVRRQKTQPITIQDPADANALPDHLSQTPDAQVASSEDRTRILYCLKQLPNDPRDAFIMKQETTLSIEELGEMMGATAETIKSRLRYAMQKLRRCSEGMPP